MTPRGVPRAAVIALGLLVAALLTPVHADAMAKYVGWAISKSGQALSGVSVTVNVASTGATATVYSDNGVTAQVNPFLSAADGSYTFYARNGRYNVTFVKSGYTFDSADTADIVLYDPADAGGIVSVKDYGAKGDGVTDDTTAIQAALTDAKGKGWQLSVPPGTYITSSALTITWDQATFPDSVTKSFRVFGSGTGSVIHRTGTGTVLKIDVAQVVANPTMIEIDHLKLEGTTAATKIVDITGVSVLISLHDVFLNVSSQAGAQATCLTAVGSIGLRFNHNYVNNCPIGLSLQNITNDFEVTNSRIINWTTYGVVIDGSVGYITHGTITGNIIEGPVATGGTHIGIDINSANYINVISNRFEITDAGGVNIGVQTEGSAQNIYLIGNYWSLAGTSKTVNVTGSSKYVTIYDEDNISSPGSVTYAGARRGIRQFIDDPTGQQVLSLSVPGTLYVGADWPGGQGGMKFDQPASAIWWSGRSYLLSPTDGVIQVLNNANTGFTRLDLGPATASFPALAVNGSDLKVVRADGTTAASVEVTGNLQIGSGSAIAKHLSATASLDFAAWGGGDCQDLTIAVTGAADGNTVALGIPTALASVAGVTWHGWVSGAGVVTVRGCKITVGASADPAPATVRADVWQH